MNIAIIFIGIALYVLGYTYARLKQKSTPLDIVHYSKYQKKWKIITGDQVEFTDEILLQDVTFFVTEEGRAIIVDRVQNGESLADARFPHAFIMGTLRNPQKMSALWYRKWKRFSYNPLEHHAFTDQDGRAIMTASYVYIKGRKIRYV